MIYLFERVYIASDHNIRNDRKKMTVLLGPCATEAKNCNTLSYDFGQLQLDEHVENKDLAQYLTDLKTTGQGKRIQIFTDDATLIKILAFYCSSVFENADHAFVKKLIMMDKMWIEMDPNRSPLSLSSRRKGTDKLDTANIDQLISEGMAILPKLTNLVDVRLEYALGAYINRTLPFDQQLLLENKMISFVSHSLWMGDLIDSFGTTYLTLAQRRGMNLDQFTLSQLKNLLPAYSKIFNVAIEGNVDAFKQVTAQDYINFFKQANADYGCNVFPKEFENMYTEFLRNPRQFVIDNVLTVENSSKHYAAICTYGSGKINPWLWYSIAGSKADKEYINKFRLNV